jgi:two-component system phosphate regulon response regulator PhoB
VAAQRVRAAAAGSSSAARVALVVDDEPSVRRFISAVLSRKGWSVVEASDGSAALALVATRRPSLVVTDYEMPELSGLELARRLRSVDPQLPILMVSGQPDAAAGILSVPGGRTGFAVKPFSPDELIAGIETLVGPP